MVAGVDLDAPATGRAMAKQTEKAWTVGFVAITSPEAQPIDSARGRLHPGHLDSNVTCRLILFAIREIVAPGDADPCERNQDGEHEQCGTAVDAAFGGLPGKSDQGSVTAQMGLVGETASSITV